MFLLQGFSMPKSVLPFCLVNVAPNLIPFSSPILPSLVQYSGSLKSPACFAVSRNSDSKHDPEPTSKPKRRKGLRKMEVSKSKDVDADGDGMFPTTKLRKPRRGRKSEAGAVEDYVRESLEQTFASIRQQNSEGLENMESVFKERVEDSVDSETSDDDDDHDEEDNLEGSDVGKGKRKKKMVVEADDPNWPLDADVGWGIRASEYFDQHPIKNVVGEDGFVIDWEGEIDDSWVKEINCLEWESFAFHPSPLVVLVFERYNRATNNWKTLKELEKAIQVYWSAKDRLPPRAVKVDINIERDLAYALKVKECPQILFLLGNRILYREKEFRTSDELVQMIAHFYYKARRPSWIDKAAVYPPC